MLPRILYIQPIRLPTEKAHGYQIMKTCEALVNIGYSVELYVTDRSVGITSDPFEVYGVQRGFSLTRLPVIDWLGRIPEMFEPFAFWLMRSSFFVQLKRRIDALNTYDVWYTRDLLTASVLRSLNPHKPIVIELHEAPVVQEQSWKRIQHACTRFVVISRALQRFLEDAGVPSNNITLAPDGFDADAFAHLPTKSDARARLGIASDIYLAIYTGHLFPWKGVDSLAPALDALPEGCELVLVGGTEEDIQRVRARVPKQATRVRFVGHIPRADVLWWMAAADVAVLPTSGQFEIGRLYTSPLKLFEYLAAGLPVIASDVPSSREILDERVASFFTPDNGMDFIRVLQATWQRSKEDRDRMAIDAHMLAQTYRWSDRAERIHEAIQASCSDR